MTDLSKALDAAMDLHAALRDAHGNCTATEFLLLLPMAGKAAELIDGIQALRNAIGVKVPDDLPAVETSCYTCKHEERENHEMPCKFCTVVARHPFTGQSNRWEPK